MVEKPVNLPNGWTPRSYQRGAWSYLEGGGKRCALAWHRRSGKDDVGLHWAAVSCHQRVGNYWHMLPEAAQARKAIWEAVNPHTGRRRINEAFPLQLRASTREDQMYIRFHNGSTWQVVGSDNYASLVGSPPIGVVFSEYARANPASWAYLRPILAENDGWALFISTFLGRNHHHALVMSALDWPDWYGEILSAEDTGVFSGEALARELAEYISDYGHEEGTALYRQEYMSDPSASIQGSYYGAQVSKAEKDGRVTVVPYERSALVYTGWDLGANDRTAIWFAQAVGMQPRMIDYYEASNQDLAHYASIVHGRGYAYGGHFLPHDGASATVHTNMSAQSMLSDLGLQNVIVTRRARDGAQVVMDINIARGLIERSAFDAKKCARGLDALRNYRREFNAATRQYSSTPRHDWASDGADAFRTLALNIGRMHSSGISGGAMVLPEWHDMAVA